MTDFHRSLDRALTKTSSEAAGPYGSGEAAASGDFPTTAPDADPTERQDGTAPASLQGVGAIQLRLAASWLLFVGSVGGMWAALVWALTGGRLS